MYCVYVIVCVLCVCNSVCMYVNIVYVDSVCAMCVYVAVYM